MTMNRTRKRQADHCASKDAAVPTQPKIPCVVPVEKEPSDNSQIGASKHSNLALSPYNLASSVGNENTEITDDVIQVSTNLMKAYTNELNSPYIAYYTPAQLHLITTLNDGNQRIPLDKSSINIHPLSGHWVTTYFNVNTERLCIYDSLMSTSHLIEVKKQLRLIYGNRICAKAEYVNVTQQSVQPVCGVMAIAFAFTCLCGEDPAYIQYDISRVRHHLQQCFLLGQMQPFPTLQQSNKDSRSQETNLDPIEKLDTDHLLHKYFEDQRHKNTERLRTLSEKLEGKQIRKIARKEKDKLRKRIERKKLSCMQKTIQNENDCVRKKNARLYTKTDLTINQRERLRKETERKQLSPDKKRARNVKDRLRKRTEWRKLSSDQKKNVKEKNRLRKENQRQNFSSDQKKTENDKDRLRKKSEREKVSSDQKKNENDKDRLRKKSQRKKVSSDQKKTENDKDRLRKKSQREKVSSDQKKTENDKDRLRKKSQRKKVSSDQKKTENDKDRLRKKSQRKKVSYDQKKTENDKDRLRKKSQRKKVSSDQKRAFNEKDRLRKKTEWNRLSAQQKKTQNEKERDKKRANRALSSFDSNLCCSQFRSICCEGPVYVCCSCLRLLYKHSVIKLNVSNYGKFTEIQNVLSMTHQVQNKHYICKTCDKYFKKGKLPPQNFSNNLYMDQIPGELADLTSLESRLVAQRIPFMKLSARPSGGQRAISGAVVNVPVDTVDTCTQLPRPPPNSDVIMLQLKRKTEYKSSILSQYIRPAKVMAGLDYLIKNNSLYKGISKNTNAFSIDNDSEWHHVVQQDNPDFQDLNRAPNLCPNAQTELHPEENTDKVDKECSKPHSQCQTSKTDDSSTHDYSSTDTDSSDSEHEEEKCLPFDSCLQPSDGNEIFSIAPAEGNKPISLFTDTNAEHLSFPVLFPNGRFGYTYERNIKLQHKQYVNSRLLNVDTRFATNTDYIFYSQFHSEKKQLLDNIQIALRKSQGRNTVTVADIRSSETLQTFVSHNLAYMLLKNIRGSPAYWQKCMYDLLAMVRQLGVFTWFLTLSSADMKWTDIIRIIAQQHGVSLDDNDVTNMSWEEKCKWLRNNPVTAARHFDYKVQQFFKFMLVKHKVLGEIREYFIRTEFQQRGSPHVHCVIWVKDAPICGVNTEEEVCAFVDNYISCQLPSETDDPELYQLVSTLQQHRHTRTCRKSGKLCRFNFPKISVPYTLLTTVTQPPTQNKSFSCDTNEGQLDQPTLIDDIDYNSILKKVGQTLYSCKERNISISLQQVLEMNSISEKDYVDAIKHSESSVKIFHKREPCDEHTNNYNPTIMKSWQANMDLQYVTDVYACIKYIVSYVTKDERQLSDLLRNASKEVKRSPIRQQLKHLGNIFLNHREVSAQEAIYRVLPIPLKRTSRSVLFVPTDMEEDRVKLIKPSHLIEHLEDDSEDIYCNSLPERYAARPDSLENMCLAEFAASYTSYTEQPDDFQSIDISSNSDPPKLLKLKDGKGYMSKRKEQCLIRTHMFSKFKEPDKYYHSKLMLYLPWRIEDQLVGDYGTYENSFKEQQDSIQENMQLFEKNSETVEDAVNCLENESPPVGAWELINSEAIQADLEDLTHPSVIDPDLAILNPEYHNIQSSDTVHEITANHVDFTVKQSILSDEEYRKLVRSLNTEQRQIFDTKLTWCRSYRQAIKSGEKPDPFYTYVTGGAGTGKSVLIKAIQNMAVRELRAEGESPDDCTVLLLAPTGTAAFNINGNTIHSALRLPIKQHSSSGDYLPLSHEKLQDLRCRLKNLTIVIIDEISMVSAQDLFIIHRRLMEIKGVTLNTSYFGGVSILAVGDLYQLSPVCGKPVYSLPKSPLARLAGSLWMQLFKMYQLEQIMRQKDDQAFALTLNRIRLQKHSEDDVKMLKTRVISKESSEYPSDALHMFADNKTVDEFNDMRLQTLSNVVTFHARDLKPSGIDIPDTLTLSDKPALTGGLAKELNLAIGARVMVTKNIDVADGLTNGTQGIVVGFYPESFENDQKVIAVIVKCDSQSSGVNTRQKYRQVARKYPNAVPIFRDEVRISISNRGNNYVSRLQFPLRLAWACTIHKTQGMTLKTAVVSFKGRFFNGQSYVALSRVSSLSGLFITDFAEEKIRASSKTEKAMTEMSDTGNILTIPTNPMIQQPTNLFSISLLNIRSFTRHFTDISSDKDFPFVDVLCYTETWLKKEKTPNIPQRTSFRQDRHGKRSGGVIMYVTSSFSAVLTKRFSDKNIELIAVKVTSFRIPMNIILVYVSVNAKKIETIKVIEDILIKIPSSECVIVLGDFNKLNLPSLLNNLVPIVNVPTINTGSTVDQVYVSEDLQSSLYLSTPYYSDHQTIWIGVKLQCLLFLRHEEFDEGCKAACNGPYDGRWSKSMVGYGAEDTHFVIELTYNYGVGTYKVGNDFMGLTILSKSIYDTVKQKCPQATPASDNTLTVQSPDGYKFHVVNENSIGDPVKKVTLASSNLQKSLDFWTSLCGMELYNKEEKKALLGYSKDQCALELCDIGAPVDHATAFGRIAFSCPRDELAGIQDKLKSANQTILTPLVSLDTPGKATVEVVIPADPKPGTGKASVEVVIPADSDGHEICFVGDEAFRELSQVDEKADQLLDEGIAGDKSDEWYAKKGKSKPSA